MNLTYETARLEKLCNQKSEMVGKLGSQGARKLRARLADLEAATVLADIKRGRPHELRGNFAGCIALDLDGGRRLVIRPADDPLPLTDSGGLDWSQVTAVCIVFVGDYHD